MKSIRQTVICRILATILAVITVISVFAVGTVKISAETAEIPSIRIEDKTLPRGQTFELNVYLDKNPGLVAMVLELKYDKSVMSLVGIKNGDALASHTFTTTNTQTDLGYLVEPFRLLWDGTTKDSTTGLLVTLVFESKITAPLGDYQVQLSYDEENTNSEYGKPIAVEIDNGVVTLISGEYDVVYKNWDGTELQRIDYNGLQVPSYTGKTPTRPTDEMYFYTFKGWKGAVPNTDKEVWYIADYATTPQEYQAIFYVDGEFFRGDIVAFGEPVNLSNVPSEKNYTFSGWYADETFTQKVNFQRMPASDIKLYGYMQFNIRRDEIPQIMLSVDKIENDVAYVNIDVTRNPSLAGLVLTLDYDREALEFIGFERKEAFANLQFSYTNIENGYNVDPFKFYWESAVNTVELGTLVTLKFKLNQTVDPGMYKVNVIYDERSDATYFTDEQDLWYTKLEIIGTQVPIGKIYHWYEETEDGIGIDVTTEEGQLPDTVLEIKRVTDIVRLDAKKVTNVAGENIELKDVYSVRLLRNGKEIKPNGKITVKIELTEEQLACEKLAVLRIGEADDLTIQQSAVKDGFVVFEPTVFSDFAIVGDFYVGAGIVGGANDSMMPIICLSLLAIVTMAFVLILIARNRRRKQIFNYEKGE